LNRAHIRGTQYKPVKTIMLSTFHINLAATNGGAVKVTKLRKESNAQMLVIWSQNNLIAAVFAN
jgi:hypothetical protein